MVDELWSQMLAIAASPGGPSVFQAGSSAQLRLTGSGWQWAGHGDDAAAASIDGAATDLFNLFKPLLDACSVDRPWVVGQLGQSLDGCIATRSGESAFVSGPECLRHLHRLRALCDAVVVGVGTVCADNPRLTTRLVPGPNATRVLLDPRLSLIDRVGQAQVFAEDGVPTLWLCDKRWRGQAVGRVGEKRTLAVAGLLRPDGTPDAAAALAALHGRGLRRVLVEGGGVTVSRFLAQHTLDRLHLSVAPVLIGDGRRGLHFTGAARLGDCARPCCRVFTMGVDRLWDLDLRA